jgi:hypothetical protein
VPDTSFLYSTVKNLMGVDHVFGYLPPHGKKLLANQTYTVPGDLATRILSRRPTPMIRSFKSLERDLLANRLAIESTPRPIFFDANPPAAVANPTVAITASNAAGSTLWTGTTGAYTLWYTWINAYGETTVGASQLAAPVTLTNGVSKLQTTTPALPTGATGVNYYISAVGSTSLATAVFLFTTATGGAQNGPANVPSLTALPGSNTAKIAAPARQPAVNITGGGAAGGSLASGAYFLKYTWTTPLGETTGSPESQTFTVAAGNIPSVSIDPAPPGATGVNVYLTAAGGGSNTEVLYDSYPVPVTGSPPSVLAGYLQPGVGSSGSNPETPLSLILLSGAAPSSAVTVPGANTALLPVPTLTPVISVQQSGVPGPLTPLSVQAPYLAPGGQGDVVNGAPQFNGLLQAGTYLLKYTYTGPSGETTPSPESVAFTVAAGQIPLVQLADPARDPSGIGLFPAGVTGVNIYLTAAGGAANSETLYLSGVTSATVKLTIAQGGQVPPLQNTTQGHSIRSIRVNNDTVGTVDPSWGSYEGPQ